MRTPRTLLLSFVLLPLALCACKPEPPDRQQPPAPQAAAPAADTHTELRDAMQRPIQRAEQVEVDVQQAADAQRKAIEAAGG